MTNPTAGRQPDSGDPGAHGSGSDDLWQDSQASDQAADQAGDQTGRSSASRTDARSSEAAEQEDLLARTRVSQTWIALIVFAVILILLLIFVLQNTRKVNISYFTADFTMPLAVAMLLSAVAGILLTAIAGTLRILQLRRRVRKGQRG